VAQGHIRRQSLREKLAPFYSIATAASVRRLPLFQNFERIARKRFVTLVRQSQSDAPPIRLGSLSDQVPTCLKRLNGL
jgi:hypothetical protein